MKRFPFKQSPWHYVPFKRSPWKQAPWKQAPWGHYHHWLLLLWVGMGLWLRFHNLSLKPLWADECSTLVFSLGHSFRTVPLNHLISVEQLLTPLQLDGHATPLNAVQGLLAESNHPPLYFILTHLWMDLGNRLGYSDLGYGSWGYGGWGYGGWGYGASGPIELVSIGFARALSAGFGVLAIPITYGLIRSLGRPPHPKSHLLPPPSALPPPPSALPPPPSALPPPPSALPHLAALLMALSPFGIYLAQEARHYTLTTIWILGSLACLVRVMQCLHHRRSIPVWLLLVWIGCNGLGIATHYFFSLTLLAEAVVLTAGLIRFRGPFQIAANGWRIGAIALGTLASGAVWLPFLLAIQPGDELTRWIQAPADAGGLAWINPLLHTVASIVTMFYLLPVQGVPSWVAIASGLTVTTAIVITVVMLKQVAPQRLPTAEIANDIANDDAFPIVILLGVMASAIAIMLGVTYGLGMDISQAFRYHFVYWPAMMWVGAWGLARLWRGTRLTRATVLMVLSLALCGAITVSANLGYQKVHRPDQVVKVMAERSHHPLVVAISHQSHGQTGRLMALAWAMQHYPDWPGRLDQQAEGRSPQFFLDHQPCDRAGEQNCNAPSTRLRQTLGALSDRKSGTFRNAYDLWLINYRGQTNLKRQRCKYRKTKRFDGYKAQHYVCALKE